MLSLMMFPCLLAMLQIELGALQVLGQNSTIELHTYPTYFVVVITKRTWVCIPG